MRLTRDRADAEDLVQRTCLRALERRWQCSAGSAVLSWLFSIMHTVWLNEVRARQRRRESSLDWEDDWTELLPALESSDPSVSVFYRQIIEAVESLPEAQRLVMLLVDIEGLTYKEAAAVLCVPLGTVMSRLARARGAVGERFIGAQAPTTRRKEGMQ